MRRLDKLGVRVKLILNIEINYINNINAVIDQRLRNCLSRSNPSKTFL